MLIRTLAEAAVEEAEKKKIQGPKEPASFSKVTFKDVIGLLTHLETLTDRDPTQIRKFNSIAAGVGSLPIAKGVPRELLVRLVAILQCNSVSAVPFSFWRSHILVLSRTLAHRLLVLFSLQQGVLDLEQRRRGDVIIAPADFNHSCNPNTVRA